MFSVLNICLGVVYISKPVFLLCVSICPEICQQSMSLYVCMGFWFVLMIHQEKSRLKHLKK